MKFWDSSAIVTLIVPENATEIVKTIAAGDCNLVYWWGTQVECCSTFARLRREGHLTVAKEQACRAQLDDMVEYWAEVEPSSEVRACARRLLMRHALRAADSLQLAAALTWSGPQTEGAEFVCLDKRLRDAAVAEGFTVLPAEMPTV
jgi:uncharacterized protein